MPVVVPTLKTAAPPRPVMVDAAWVPVWLALASKVASELFEVAAVAIPSSFVLSVADIEPAALVEAAEIEIAGEVPPELTIGAVPVTSVMPPPPPPPPPVTVVVEADVIRPAASIVRTGTKDDDP